MSEADLDRSTGPYFLLSDPTLGCQRAAVPFWLGAAAMALILVSPGDSSEHQHSAHRNGDAAGAFGLGAGEVIVQSQADGPLAMVQAVESRICRGKGVEEFGTASSHARLPTDCPGPHRCRLLATAPLLRCWTSKNKAQGSLYRRCRASCAKRRKDRQAPRSGQGLKQWPARHDARRPEPALRHYFSKVSKMEQRQDGRGAMVAASPARHGIYR